VSPFWKWTVQIGRVLFALGRIAIALVALFFSFFLVMLFLLAPFVKNRKADEIQGASKLRVVATETDQLPIKGAVEGELEAGKPVTVSIGPRKYSGRSSSDGVLHIPIELLPGRDQRIMADIGSGFFPLMPPELSQEQSARIPASIDLCLASGETLWVAGRRHLRFSELVLNAGPQKTEIRSDWNGYFDVLIALTSTTPKEVSVQLQDGRAFTSAVKSASVLPLSRKTEIWFEAGIPNLRLTAELPKEHPLFFALVGGFIDAYTVPSAIFGWIPNWGNKGPVASFSSEGATGTIKIEATLAGPVTEIQIRKPFGYGIEEKPLLSTNDLVTVSFGDVKPTWFGEPLPSKWNETNAVWQGPISLSIDGIRFGVRLPEGINEKSQDTTDVVVNELRDKASAAPKTMRDWVATDRFGADEGFLHEVWRTLVFLTPCLAFIWILVRRPFGRTPIVQSVGAAACVFAVLSLFRIGYSALTAVTEPWLDSFISLGWNFTDFEGEDTLKRTLIRGHDTAFVMVCLCVSASVPGLFRFFQESLLVLPTPSVRALNARFSIKVGWFSLRFLWSTIWAAAFTIILLWARSFSSRQRLFDWASAKWMQVFDSKIPDFQSFEQASTPEFLLLSLATVAGLMLLGLGIRAFGFGLGVLLITIRFFDGADPIIRELENKTGIFNAVHAVPWWLILAISTCLAVVFVSGLINWLLPTSAIKDERRLIRWSAIGFTIFTLVLPFLTPKSSLIIGGTVLLTTAAWLFLAAVGRIEPVDRLEHWRTRGRFRTFLIGAGLLLLIAWPIAAPEETLSFGELHSLLYVYRSVFIVIIATLFVFALKDYSDRFSGNSPFLAPAVLTAGVVFFSFFAVQSGSTWAFIPIPIVVALVMARFWLISFAEHPSQLKGVLAAPEQTRKAQVSALLVRNRNESRLNSIEKALGKKLDNAELTADAYEEKLRSYRDYFRKHLDITSETEADSAVHAVLLSGHPGSPWKTAVQFMKVGAFLSAVPLVATLYQYLPARSIAYPYPSGDLISVVLRSIAGWLLIAFFFGYFFVHVTGRTGFGKGLAVFIGLVTPLALHKLLYTPTVSELKPFVLWATQIFVFCTMLGIASDYRILKRSGYKLKDLLTLHNLPWISVYASSILVAVVPTAVALVTGKLNEVVKFFIETVLPTVK
jgi:hypothetical protein